MGQKELETTKDFSKWGRMEHMLKRRQELLEAVRDIALALDLAEHLGIVEYTCESADHFFRHKLVTKWTKFQEAKQNLEDDKEKLTNDWLTENFPFVKCFKDTRPQPMFDRSADFESNYNIAEDVWADIEKVFTELRDCRAFELFRSTYDRGNYLLCRQSKIIAMTCTYAALKRHDFVNLHFEYDNIVMEEAAQILEIETFIPMLLQNPTNDGGSRLKRVVLIGDHNQLPPVVKNMAFQKYSHMDQSLFTRFVRLGVPTIQLNAQGRMRPTLADLYRWRYKDLHDLPHVTSQPRFQTANPGFTYEYQCIDVPEYHGKGEEEPQAHFFQNLGEAEYIVACYMYMRLIGYPAEKITILTTYNGQKVLLREVLEHRCGPDTVFGMPSKVSTVDKYQGQQNDYILLSLVRTANVGHIRDVRRLVVAVSRARLGLYVFCRMENFKKVWELKPVFSQFAKRPNKLCLNMTEMSFPTSRSVTDTEHADEIDDLVALGKLVHGMASIRIKTEQEKWEKQTALWEAKKAELAKEQAEKEAAERAAEAQKKKQQEEARIKRLMEEQKKKKRKREQQQGVEHEEEEMEEKEKQEVQEPPKKEEQVVEEDDDDDTSDEEPQKKQKVAKSD
eukprot:TRINITY_DN60985_c0_g1_i1.p1 TRINITY_DN60985_c0_g1~~TRINITY_DN60985_c0_g1_i1.p1  ORF type:complete len:618 (+),score=117.05 TRINITY_DN60985_c0_g1_i1:783-2636(+)